MAEFTAQISSPDPVDLGTAQAFDGVLRSIEGAVRQANESIAQLQTRLSQEEQRNENNRQRTKDLEAEIRQLRQQLGEDAGQDAPNAPVGVAEVGLPKTWQTKHDEARQPAFRLEREIAVHNAPVHSVAMGRDHVVASASWDATVKLYSLSKQEVVQTLGCKDAAGNSTMGGLYAVAFAKTVPDVLGCTSADKSVYLWKDGSMAHKLVGHQDEVNGIDFHNIQQVMVTASDDMKAIIWDFGEGITLRTLAKHTKQVYGAAFLGSENQYCVATCCFDQKTRIFDMRDKQLVSELQHHTDDVIGIDYSSRHNILATGSDDGTVCIWDARKWQLRQVVNTRVPGTDLAENEVKRVAWSEDGEMLAAACSSQRVLLYKMSGGVLSQAPDELAGHKDCVFDVAWGTNPQTGKKLLVSASHDHTSRIWHES